MYVRMYVCMYVCMYQERMIILCALDVCMYVCIYPTLLAPGWNERFPIVAIP